MLQHNTNKVLVAIIIPTFWYFSLLDQPKQQQSHKENTKLIKSIKFWRGTTPIVQVKEKQQTKIKNKQQNNFKKNEATESEDISKNDR